MEATSSSRHWPEGLFYFQIHLFLNSGASHLFENFSTESTLLLKELKEVNDKLSAHVAAKEYSTGRKNLGRYVDKFHHGEYSEMKRNYVTTRVVRSSVIK